MVGAFLHSFIIAKALGLYLIILAIVMILRADYYKDIMQHIEKEKLAALSGASISLVLGLLLLSVHNFWALEPYVLVTIIAWVIVIKSVLWLAMPLRMATIFHDLFSGRMYYVLAVIMGLVGVVLFAYAAFLFAGPLPLSVDVMS